MWQRDGALPQHRGTRYVLVQLLAGAHVHALN